MSRFEQVRAGLRRTYESVRSSSSEAGAGSQPAEPPPIAPPYVPVRGLDSEQEDVRHPSTTSRDDAEVPHALRLAAGWSWRLIVVGIIAWTLLQVVDAIQLVMIPVAVALLLSALLTPAVGWLLRARFPRSLATAVVLIAGLAAVVGTLTLVVNQFIAGVPELSDKATTGVRQIQDWLKTGPLHLSDSQLNQYIDQGQQWVNENTQSLTSGALSTATTLFEFLTGGLLVLFSTFFFLRDGRLIWRFIVRLMPVNARWRIDDAGTAAWHTLVAYVRATVLVAFIDAVGIGIFLIIFKIPFAFPLIALVFLGAFIPIVGAALSGTVAVLVALVDQGWVIALVILGAVVAVQQLEGHVLQPLIMGRAVAIHPLAVIIGIASFAVLAGIVGAIVAVPVIAVLNTAVRRLARRSVPEVPPDAVVVAADAP